MYAPLAQSLVAAAPVPLAGRLVLDLGAGTGVAGRAALAAGARRVVAADLSEGMLRRGRGGTPVVADAVALPFRDGRFDLVLAAFCLNHLDRVEDGLAEARRVGAAIAASTFAPGWTHPAKDAADGALRSFGYQPPDWYAALAPGSRAGRPRGPRRERGRRRVHPRSGAHRRRPDRPGHPRRAGVMAAGHGPLRPVPALARPVRAGRGAARGRAGRGRRRRQTGPLVVSMAVLTAS